MGEVFDDDGVAWFIHPDVWAFGVLASLRPHHSSDAERRFGDTAGKLLDAAARVVAPGRPRRSARIVP